MRILKSRLVTRLLIALALLFLLGLIDRVLAILLTDLWWFQELGYAQTYTLQLSAQVLLATLGCGLTGLWLGGNYLLALRRQTAPPPPPVSVQLTDQPLLPQQLSRPVWQLPLLLLIFISSLWGLGGLAAYHWDRCWQVLHQTSPLLTLTPWHLATHPQTLTVTITLLLLWSIGTTCWPSSGLSLLIITLSGSWGYYWAIHWHQVLPALSPTAFPNAEPVFGRNLGFYIFHLPLRELIDEWLCSLTVAAGAIALLLYLRPHLSSGFFPGFTPQQQRHLSILGSTLSLAIAHHFSLARYQLLYSQRGVVYGAGFTDLKVHLGINNILIVGSCGIAFYLLIQSGRGWAKQAAPSWLSIPFGGGLLLLFLIPVLVQQAIVQPNELAQEKPYLQRSIAFTRQAFELDRVEVRTFDPTGNLTAQDIANNDETIKNIRLWDARPLLQSNRQLQQIRPYYKFANADIDRYPIQQENQQVILSARELDIRNLVSKAQTWINQHLVYTHGYGFTVSPVNRAAASGLPDYLVKDIGVTNGDIPASDPSVDVDRPRIYYGELTDNYIFTPSKVSELDYPSGNDNVYNTYDGQGGIPIRNWWRRWITSQYLQDWQVLVTPNFTAQTKLLLHRQITERAQRLAPWLLFDGDPYIVVATAPQTHQNHLYWLLDGYSISSHFPYADPGSTNINYIRNSVKVVINAYDGHTQFYVSDAQDPILQTWQRILPHQWQPMSAMPPSLRAHLRYPSDLFRMQADRLRTYHMEDPQVFYNREDLWQIPQEIYGGKAQAVEPYYLITKLPTASHAEFILLSPFAPNQRTNLIAWLAARADGEQYGKLLLYQFPKQQLIYGPEQIESLINQDTVISQQISLWNRQGVKVVQGNLLVIPLERSLLYVEPLYLEAQQNGLPTLGRVVVVYRDRIVMAKTLNQALQSIFPVASETSS